MSTSLRESGGVCTQKLGQPAHCINAAASKRATLQHVSTLLSLFFLPFHFVALRQWGVLLVIAHFGCIAGIDSGICMGQPAGESSEGGKVEAVL